MVEANPGERTGGEKDKDALHRTPAQRAKRYGPGPDEEVKDAEMMPEHGAQGSGEILEETFEAETQRESRGNNTG